MNFKIKIGDDLIDFKSTPTSTEASLGNFHQTITENETFDPSTLTRPNEMKKSLEEFKNQTVYVGNSQIRVITSTASDQVIYEIYGKQYTSIDEAAEALYRLRFGVSDDLQDREVGGRVYKTKEFNSAEEANKFMEDNPGFSYVDEENGKVYLTPELPSNS